MNLSAKFSTPPPIPDVPLTWLMLELSWTSECVIVKLPAPWLEIPPPPPPVDWPSWI